MARSHPKSFPQLLEQDLRVWSTHESRRVVITGGFGVAVRLHDWVGLNNLVL